MEAARGGLDRTLMQEIADNKPDTVSLLKVQYRMNDEIMRFSSEWFYQGELKSAPEVKYRSILDYDTPIEWINTEGMECNEEFVGESFGRINKEEAALSKGQIGFLNDLRRMNVAITRARMKLIILGDASTLTKHPFYKKLYEYILALQE